MNHSWIPEKENSQTNSNFERIGFIFEFHKYRNCQRLCQGDFSDVAFHFPRHWRFNVLEDSEGFLGQIKRFFPVSRFLI